MRMWSCLNLAAAQAGPGALTREGQELCLPQEALVPSVYAMCGYRDISLSIAAAGPLSRSQDGFSREQRAIFPGKQSPASLPLSSLAEGHGSAGGRAWYLHAGAQLPRDAASGAWCFIHGPVAPAPPHPRSMCSRAAARQQITSTRVLAGSPWTTGSVPALGKATGNGMGVFKQGSA